MGSADEYRRRLLNNLITPNVIEDKIRDLRQELDDEQYYFDQGIRIGEPAKKKISALTSQIKDLTELLAFDYAQAVARGLETPVSAVANTPVPASIAIQIPHETYDGTPLSHEEGVETLRLLKMVENGQITKKTLLDFISGLTDQLAQHRNQNTPAALELLARRGILRHVVVKGKFTRKDDRRFKHYR